MVETNAERGVKIPIAVGGKELVRGGTLPKGIALEPGVASDENRRRTIAITRVIGPEGSVTVCTCRPHFVEKGERSLIETAILPEPGSNGLERYLRPSTEGNARVRSALRSHVRAVRRTATVLFHDARLQRQISR